MSATELRGNVENGLDRLGAAGSAMLGLFLLVGGAGHLAAVWPGAAAHGSMLVPMPGLLLLAAGVFNLAAGIWLWRGRTGWQWAALAANGVLAVYLARLLTTGVPDHPIGAFLVLVCGQVIILGGLLAGLQWKSPDA